MKKLSASEGKQLTQNTRKIQSHVRTETPTNPQPRAVLQGALNQHFAHIVSFTLAPW